MPRRLSLLGVVSDVADAQLGLITAEQLVEIGVTRSTTQHRIRTGGPWTRVLPGIYLVTGGRPDRLQQCRAAILYAGAGAVLSGLDALYLLGVERGSPPPDRPVHVLIPHERRRASTGFVLVERTRRVPETVERHGFVVASVARASVDTARRWRRRADVDATLARAVQRGSVPVEALEDETVGAHRRSTALLRDALSDLRAGTRSAPEATLRRLWLESGLPEPLWNVPLHDHDGTFIAQPDAYVREVGFAFEVDSVEFHYDRAAWQATMLRHERMAARGLVVMHAPPTRIVRAGAPLMHDVERALAALHGRPAPDLRIG
jgi:hypothetical protein